MGACTEKEGSTGAGAVKREGRSGTGVFAPEGRGGQVRDNKGDGVMRSSEIDDYIANALLRLSENRALSRILHA